MNKEQIIQVIENESLPDTWTKADYVETPNSWIIRSDNHAFKIRKSIQANGQDLSNLELRKETCLKEVKFNKPLAGKVYEEVIPLKKINTKKSAPKEKELIVVDYAVMMKRLDEKQKLLRLIKKGEITNDQIREIASVIAKFHKKADIVKNTFNITRFQERYEEIKRCEDFASDLLGENQVSTIYKSIEFSKEFLSDYRLYIQERTIEGFIRDVHGNLKADTIYLNKTPIITDRHILIDKQRKVDVLFDIAFLGIDFDFYKLYEYDEEFLKQYLKKSGAKYSNKTKALYTYFKLYRTGQRITKMLDANIISSLSESRIQDIARYFELLTLYMDSLNK